MYQYQDNSIVQNANEISVMGKMCFSLMAWHVKDNDESV